MRLVKARVITRVNDRCPSPRQHGKGAHFRFSVRGGACCQHHQQRREHRAKSHHGKLLPLLFIRITLAGLGAMPPCPERGEAGSDRRPPQAGPTVRIHFPPPESRVNFRFLSGGAPSAVRSGIGHECRAHRSANPGPRPSGAYQVSHSTISLPTGRIIGFVECGRALARHGSAEFAGLNRVEGYVPDGTSTSLAHLHG
jgi:hypothetical protein